MACAEFISRIQGKEESVITYHGLMKVLSERAYQLDERREITLIRQFISGLSNSKIPEQMHLHHPDFYQEAFDFALRLEGTYKVFVIENKSKNEGKPSQLAI
jgi:hypothetical protein